MLLMKFLEMRSDEVSSRHKISKHHVHFFSGEIVETRERRFLTRNCKCCSVCQVSKHGDI